MCAGLREEAANDGRPFRQLIYVKPEEHLNVLVERLTANEVSSAPCLTTEPDGALFALIYTSYLSSVSHVLLFCCMLSCRSASRARYMLPALLIMQCCNLLYTL